MNRRGFLARLIGAPAVAKVAPTVPPLLPAVSREVVTATARMKGFRLVFQCGPSPGVGSWKVMDSVAAPLNAIQRQRLLEMEEINRCLLGVK